MGIPEKQWNDVGPDIGNHLMSGMMLDPDIGNNLMIISTCSCSQLFVRFFYFPLKIS